MVMTLSVSTSRRSERSERSKEQKPETPARVRDDSEFFFFFLNTFLYRGM